MFFEKLKREILRQHSPEYLKKCVPYDALAHKYTELADQYSNSYQELYDNALKHVCSREYSKGGDLVHRGFYTPCKMSLVTGGMNIGRLYKREPKDKSVCTYEYWFDKNGKLVCSILLGDYIEFFVYDGNSQLSFGYNIFCGRRDLAYISECKYNGDDIIKYEHALISYELKCSEISIEDTEYENGAFKSFIWTRYVPDIKLLTHTNFVFSRDEDGRLAEYTAEEIGTDHEKRKYPVMKIHRDRFVAPKRNTEGS